MLGTLSSCDDEIASECEERNCTLEFRSIGISFADNKGAPAEVKQFSVINQRTKKTLFQNSSRASDLTIGDYIVAHDGNTKDLSEEGDDLKVTATSIETNQTKSVLVKVKGGKCACHIDKVSGPEQVVFD